ncbi:hypothetical protein CAEBREN_20301 [Caenorhabditis brenneri]|uniref:Uncharacterized protein n=1 Tax=Caenorhabditis brenneri TaxID=135651 RepID=G0ND03_CAEBE|nr:hypothetical protein CAEBREN_20301 [Caenorhabditis brenneri]
MTDRWRGAPRAAIDVGRSDEGRSEVTSGVRFRFLFVLSFPTFFRESAFNQLKSRVDEDDELMSRELAAEQLESDGRRQGGPGIDRLRRLRLKGMTDEGSTDFNGLQRINLEVDAREPLYFAEDGFRLGIQKKSLVWVLPQSGVPDHWKKDTFNSVSEFMRNLCSSLAMFLLWFRWFTIIFDGIREAIYYLFHFSFIFLLRNEAIWKLERSLRKEVGEGLEVREREIEGEVEKQEEDVVIEEVEEVKKKLKKEKKKTDEGKGFEKKEDKKDAEEEKKAEGEDEEAKDEDEEEDEGEDEESQMDF